ncbi:MAG: lipopolysaccharide kinase InaA family protein [Planctomycetota bacterium]
MSERPPVPRRTEISGAIGEHIHVSAPYEDLARRLGLTSPRWAFEDPRIEVWRCIAERENGVLDAEGTRLHVKRDQPGRRAVADEARGLALLAAAGIGSAPLVAHGRLADGRSFLVTEHLHGFEDAERLLERGVPFERLAPATALLAATLHRARLHHRDLYVGHFWARLDDATPNEPTLRLIDAARVRPLPRVLARRWIVKDLGQFVYSIERFDASGGARRAWLERYASASGAPLTPRLEAAIQRRAQRIARSAARSARRDPTRNHPIDR